ncbi:MAG: hypothetical protein ABMA64_43275, partial [Myxococcota bacterium]
MGHSHHPIEELDPTGGFLNSGHWVPTEKERAFTHVRIERADRGVRAVSAGVSNRGQVVESAVNPVDGGGIRDRPRSTVV